MQLPTVSSLEFVAILRRLGFRVVAMSDQHTILRRGDDGCVVPHKQQLTAGVLRLMLAAASVSLLEFLEMQGSTPSIPPASDIAHKIAFIPFVFASHSTLQ